MWNVTHVSETESTNLLACKGAPGDVFTADYQTAGRGRLDHRWLSERGANLIMSAVIGVDGFGPADVATLPLAVGLAVVEGLSALVGDLRLKWPNDVVVGGRKLAGILCERHGEKVIAGIGVNVRQRAFPEEISARAVSLAMLGSDAMVREVRDVVLSALEGVVGEWRQGGFSAIKGRIDGIDFLKGRFVSVGRIDGDGDPTCGLCGGIADDGGLTVGGGRVYAGEAHILDGGC